MFGFSETHIESINWSWFSNYKLFPKTNQMGTFVNTSFTKMAQITNEYMIWHGEQIWPLTICNLNIFRSIFCEWRRWNNLKHQKISDETKFDTYVSYSGVFQALDKLACVEPSNYRSVSTDTFPKSPQMYGLSQSLAWSKLVKVWSSDWDNVLYLPENVKVWKSKI